MFKKSNFVAAGLVLAMLAPAYASAANTKTTLINSSSASALAKKTIVVIGDGFQSGTDQTDFNNYVKDKMSEGAFIEGPMGESLNAFDIIRVNADSVDSGVTQVNGSGTVTDSKNTALNYRYSGNWNRCWMEKSANSDSLMNTILNNLNVSPDYVMIVLNEPGFGGCRRGNQLAVTMGANWTVVAHELGHMIGGLCDEYIGGGGAGGTYTGSEPGCANLTTNTNSATIKWRDFVRPATSLPTTYDAGTMDSVATTGAFAGGTLGQTGYTNGIYRPSNTSRMNNNWPEYNSPGYDRMKKVLDPFHDHTFNSALTGDFDGDGFSDIVIPNNNSLSLYTANGNNMETGKTETGTLVGVTTWTMKPGDRYMVGDFNGDGKDDLFVHNSSNWGYPYFALLQSTGTEFDPVARYYNNVAWNSNAPILANNQYHVADFDADGKDDIYLVNTQDGTPFVTLLKSNGSSLSYVTRYSSTLPGWTMKSGDKFHVADYNGDGRDDLYVFNGSNWSMPYLLMVRSTGSGLAYTARYDSTLPGWTMKSGDQQFVADFNGDGLDDLYVFNGNNWATPYLKKAVSSGAGLTSGGLWNSTVLGWTMKPGDRFFVADVNGDNQDDLYVYNATDWGTQYLGVLSSAGNNDLTGSWQDDWIGSWNLGSGDNFLVGDFSGAAGWDDLFVFNNSWFGMLRSYSSSVGQVSIHNQWIHDHDYHKWGWW